MASGPPGRHSFCHVARAMAAALGPMTSIIIGTLASTLRRGPPPPPPPSWIDALLRRGPPPPPPPPSWLDALHAAVADLADSVPYADAPALLYEAVLPYADASTLLKALVGGCAAIASLAWLTESYARGKLSVGR